MFITMVRIFAHANERDRVRVFLEGVLGPIRVQPGCLGCTVAVESDPEALLYMETWNSREDLVRRLQSDEYAKVLATMEQSSTEPEVKFYEVTDQGGLELIERARFAQQDGEGASGHSLGRTFRDDEESRR